MSTESEQDSDPICATTSFQNLKWQIQMIQNEELFICDQRTRLDTIKASHRIAKFVYWAIEGAKAQILHPIRKDSERCDIELFVEGFFGLNPEATTEKTQIRADFGIIVNVVSAYIQHYSLNEMINLRKQLDEFPVKNDTQPGVAADEAIAFGKYLNLFNAQRGGKWNTGLFGTEHTTEELYKEFKKLNNE